MFDREYFSDLRFEITWPHDIFALEIDRLLRESTRIDLTSQSETLFNEVFKYQDASQDAIHEFKNHWNNTDDPWSPSRSFRGEGGVSGFLKALRENIEVLPSAQNRPPYWSQRRSSLVESAEKSDFKTTARRASDVIVKFEQLGYLVQAFGQDCVDGDTNGTLGSHPYDEAHRLLGREKLWPVSAYWKSFALDDLCDVIEFAYDHVSRPVERHYHDYGNCGWHYNSFRRQPAQRLFRWQINEIFNESEVSLKLNEEGRFESVASDSIEPLVRDVRSDSSSGGTLHNDVLHAVSQFRRRGASETEKRQAIISLAGILESRRNVIESNLPTKDEGALFQIANRFGIRHQRADQAVNYDKEIYFEWIFYFYLSTIRLTDRLLARS